MIGQFTQILLLTLVVMVSPAAGGWQIVDPPPPTPANEAFVEPIKTIQIASAESGIIHGVNVKLGQAVKINELMFELDQRVLTASKKIAESRAQSNAKLKAAEIQFDTRNKRLTKVERLAAESAASPEEVERAKADAMVAKQQVDEILEELEQHQLEVERLEAQIETRRIRSPINGIVTELNRKEGEHVSSNDPVIATVMELKRLRAIFHLPNQYVGNLKSGMAVDLLLIETKQHAQGTIEYVAPITRADSGRVRVDVIIPNQDYQFRSGLRCRIVNPPEQPLLAAEND